MHVRGPCPLDLLSVVSNAFQQQQHACEGVLVLWTCSVLFFVPVTVTLAAVKLPRTV